MLVTIRRTIIASVHCNRVLCGSTLTRVHSMKIIIYYKHDPSINTKKISKLRQISRSWEPQAKVHRKYQEYIEMNQTNANLHYLKIINHSRQRQINTKFQHIVKVTSQ